MARVTAHDQAHSTDGPGAGSGKARRSRRGAHRRLDGRGAVVVRDVDHDRQGAIPEVALTIRINGRPEQLQVDVRVTLLGALRDRLGPTGAKKGRDQGAVGALTVLGDGGSGLARLTLAGRLREHEAVTI